MNTPNPILAFLSEIVGRLGSKSPKFFKIIQIIAAIATLVPGIPAFLDYLGITLPDFLIAIENKTIAIAGLVATFISGLAVDTKHLEAHALSKNVSGENEKTVQVQIEEKLPFTEKVVK